jgi:hypothetical protein
VKTPLKYGSIIAVCFIAWVAIAHQLYPDPRSSAHTAGASIFVNTVQIIAIVLGIREVKRANGDVLQFKDGLKTGVGISAVYAILASLFFVIALSVLGTKMLAVEPGAEVRPLWQIILGAFLGLGVGAVLLGLVYSAIASFALATRRERR